MKKFDILFGGGIIGFIIPILTLSTFWWSSFLLGATNVAMWTLIGLIIGVLLDMAFLKILTLRFYNFNIFALIMIYIIYSIGIFGFFMGVPLFNVIPGIMAGIYIGRKLKNKGEDVDIFKREIKKVNIFSVLVLLGVCICSAILALSDPYTGANLKGMLNLSFEVTQTMIWLLIIIGGASLIAFQSIFINIVGKFAYEKIK